MNSISSFLLQKIIEAQREKNYNASEPEQQIIDTILSQLREELKKGTFCWSKKYDTDLMEVTFYPEWIHMHIMHKYGREVKGIKSGSKKIDKEAIKKSLTEIGLKCDWKSKGDKKFLQIKYAYQPEEKTQ